MENGAGQLGIRSIREQVLVSLPAQTLGGFETHFCSPCRGRTLKVPLMDMPWQMLAEMSFVTNFMQSNIAGKVIVGLLFVGSLAAWAVMISKYSELKGLHMANFQYAKALRSRPLLKEKLRGSGQALGPFAACTEAALDAVRLEAPLRLRLSRAENALQRAVAEQTVRYEKGMVHLGSIVTGAPFLGLLGTVWGVMDAFAGLADQSSASIQSLAPGVSGALLTTVMGLIVAIPSVIGYNHLLDQMRRMITELENNASELADRLELELSQESAR